MLKRLMGITLLAAPLLCAASPSSFSLTDTEGRNHTLEAYRGKWVLVNLWATWCAPCLNEMPELEALQKARSDLVVLGLAVDGQTPARVVQFAERLNVTYPIIAGSEALAKQFRPRGYPTSILFDGAGKQVLVKEGAVTRQEVENMLR
jgi:thiol-disulfide isomerase/thioredoxin